MPKCYTVSLSKGHFCITSVAAVLASDVMAGKKQKAAAKVVRSDHLLEKVSES